MRVLPITSRGGVLPKSIDGFDRRPKAGLQVTTQERHRKTRLALSLWPSLRPKKLERFLSSSMRSVGTQCRKLFIRTCRSSLRASLHRTSCSLSTRRSIPLLTYAHTILTTPNPLEKSKLSQEAFSMMESVAQRGIDEKSYDNFGFQTTCLAPVFAE